MSKKKNFITKFFFIFILTTIVLEIFSYLCIAKQKDR